MTYHNMPVAEILVIGRIRPDLFKYLLISWKAGMSRVSQAFIWNRI